MLQFRQVEAEANRRDLILEQRRRRVDGVTYRYEVTDNNSGVSVDCPTLAEAWGEIYYWPGKERFRQSPVHGSLIGYGC